MHRQVRGRGAAPIRRLIAFQLLSFRVEVAFDDDLLVSAVRYLANGAEQPVAVRATIRYAVTGCGPYELFDAGHHVATLARPDDVLYVLYARCHARLLDVLSSQGWVPVHGGIVGVGDRRVLIVGDKGAGKTTLMLRLLYDGHRVEGDELVFTREGEALCLPRNFHVKPGTLELVPDLAPGWGELPATSTSDGTVITAFNPAASGFPWKVLQAPVDAVFVLQVGHGGAAAVRALSSVAVVEAAVSNCFGVSVGRREVVRACARLLGAVDGYKLTVGPVADTACLLIAAATRTSPALCYSSAQRLEVPHA